MPKIPLYNQGQGETVQTAAGALSPRANVGAFTAPGQAQAAFAQKAGQVAFEFGMREKQRQTDTIKRERESLARETSAEFLRNDKSTSAEEAKANFATFSQNQLNEIEGLNLTKSQKQEVRNSVSRVFGIQSVQGQNNGYLRGEEKAGESYAKSIEDNIETLRSLSPDSQQYTLLMSQIDSTIDEATETDRLNFLPEGRKTKDQIRGIIQTDRTTVLTQDPQSTIEQLEAERVRVSKSFADGQIDGVAARQNESLLNTEIKTRKNLEKALGTDAENEAYEAAKTYQYETLTQGSPTLASVDAVIEQIDSESGPYEGINIDQKKVLRSQADQVRDNLIAAGNFEAGQNVEAGLIAIAQGADDSLVRKGIKHYHDTGQDDKAEETAILANAAFGASSEFTSNVFSTPNQINASLALAKQDLNEAIASQEPERILSANKKIELLTNLYENRGKAIQQDPYGYVAAELQKQGIDIQSMSASERASKMLAYQKKMGVSNVDIQLISTAEAAQIKEQYDATDASEKGAYLESLFNQYDPAMQRGVMRNLRQSGFTTIDMLIASDKSSPKNVLLNEAQAFKQEDLNKVLKPAQREEISNLVRQKMMPFTQSIAGGVGGNYFDRGAGGGRLAFTFEVEQSLIKVAQLEVYRGKSLEDAAESAFQVVGRRYDFNDVNNKSIRIPKSTTLDPSSITSYLKSKITDTEYLRSIVKSPTERGQTEETSKVLYTNRIADDGGWRTLDDDSGVYMIDGDGNFVMQEVIEFDADDNEVKKEVPIIIKFSEISGSVEQDEATRVETLLQTPGGKGKLFLEQQGFGRAETIPSFVTPPQTGSLQRSIDLAKERRGKDG